MVMDEIILGTTAGIYEMNIHNRNRSYSAPAWITESPNHTELNTESNILENQNYSQSDDQNYQTSITDNQEKEEIEVNKEFPLDFIGIITYLGITFMILSSLYVIRQIVTEMIINPNFSSFLAGWVLTVTISLLFIITIFAVDIQEAFQQIVYNFIETDVDINKKNN